MVNPTEKTITHRIGDRTPKNRRQMAPGKMGIYSTELQYTNMPGIHTFYISPSNSFPHRLHM